MKTTAAVLISILFIASACGKATPSVYPTAPQGISTTSSAIPKTATLSPTVEVLPVSTAEPSLTSTVSQPNQTLTPTPFSQAMPFISDQTPLPPTTEEINSINANQMVQIARWGMGKPVKIGYSADGKYFFVVTNLGMWLYDAKTGVDSGRIESEQKVLAGDISPDGQQIALATNSGINLYERSTGKPVQTFPYQTPAVWNVLFSPDSSHLMVLADLKSFQLGPAGFVFNLLDGSREEQGISINAASPNGQFGIEIDREQEQMRLYDITKGVTSFKQAPLAPLPAEQMGKWDRDGNFMQVALAPDGKSLAYTSIDTITFYDTDSQQSNFVYKPIETYHK